MPSKTVVSEQWNVPMTSSAGLDAAQALYQVDWDSDWTTEMTVTHEVADKLLKIRGWGQRPSGEWVSPDARVTCWHISEALALALSAEVL